jgi:hypothetical protein
MKESFEPPNYTGLKQEIEVLRERVEALESGRARPKVAGRVTRWRRLAAKPALALTAVMGAVLALGVLGAQNKQDPLFIDPDGNVNIGSARFSKIAVNQAPQPGQKVIITGDGTDVPFNVTDKSNTVNWLTVLKDGQVVMKGGNVGVGTPSASPKLQVKGSSLLSNDTGDSWFPNTDGDSYVSGTNVILRSNGNNERMRITKDGYVGIGKINPAVPLDVKGEIRGKPWTSREYEWKNDQQGSTRMTKADSSVCFLTYVGSKFSGYPVEVGITKSEGGYWVLGGGSNITAIGRAMCIGAPDDSW